MKGTHSRKRRVDVDAWLSQLPPPGKALRVTFGDPQEAERAILTLRHRRQRPRMKFRIAKRDAELYIWVEDQRSARVTVVQLTDVPPSARAAVRAAASKAVVELREQSPQASLREIGRRVGLSQEGVRRILKRAGAPTRVLPPPASP